MKYVGIDLHKHSIVCCVLGPDRVVLDRKSLCCSATETIVEYFRSLGPFEAVIEATASFDWLCDLLAPLAHRVVLAHPAKMRMIAQSTSKSDRYDAFVLAEFLALGKIAEAHRPTARQRELRTLVRHRQWLKQRRSSVMCRVRSTLARHNLDRERLFTIEGRKYLKEVKLPAADRWVLEQLLKTLAHLDEQLKQYKRRMALFLKKGGEKEQQARQRLLTIPGVGEGTAHIVIAELGTDLTRFSSQKKVVAYAGLAPGRRESAGKAKDLPISKQGPRLLRWGLIQAAWAAVRSSDKWRTSYHQLSKRRGGKRAVVAIARRLLCTIAAVLKSGQAYQRDYDRQMAQHRRKARDERKRIRPLAEMRIEDL